jgi:phosphoribosyl-AMP cyclohydrolase
MIDLKWTEDGLVPTIVQDAKTGEVLMVAYMNREALEKTIETKKTHFYSRSRKKQWLKGEESGHIQTVQEILTDCDRDTLLIKVKQEGGACHLGYRSCFVHLLDEKGNYSRVTQEKVFDPGTIYKKK